MLIQAFNNIVDKYGSRTAIKTKDKQLTYNELDSITNIIAVHITKQYEVLEVDTNNQFIALIFEHGIDMITASLGALKANIAYAPFDPSYPLERLLYMLNDSETKMIVTNNNNYQLAVRLSAKAEKEIKIINIDEQNTIVEKFSYNINEAKYIAYLLYTSGSTGKPKGVVQAQRNVLHFAKSYINSLTLSENDKMTLFSVFSHDASIVDIYSGLLSGACLYPYNIKENINIGKLSDWLIDEGITVWHSVPTLYRYFLNSLEGIEDFNKIKYAVLGGEAILEQDVIKHKSHMKNTILINLYGQSESSYNSSQFFNPQDDFNGINLGDPIPNTKLIVLNDKNKKAGKLRTGEIAVASEYIALEYWKNKDKTQEAFVNHPIYGRIYKTGDIGWENLKGKIEYKGRKDFQTKIRGYRVELEEIENCLLKHNEIEEVAVIGKADNSGEKSLNAYIVSKSELNATELKQYVSNILPDYMIPSYYMKIEKMPLTATNKIDRLALEELGIKIEQSSKIEAPRNEIDEKLIEIWREILGVEAIGINQSFFELGGHSLKATTLISKMHKEFNIEISLRDIFKEVTIKNISDYIRGKEKSIYSQIQLVEEKEYYKTSSAQKRIHTLQEFDKASTTYNMFGVFEIEGNIDINKLEKAFNTLVKRHEALRTSFEFIEGNLVQKIHKEVEVKIQYEKNVTSIDSSISSFISPFDLSKAPLLRIGLIELTEEMDNPKIFPKQQNQLTEEMENPKILPKQQHMLLLDMHHIIADGTSKVLLIREFAEIYQNKEIQPLKLQYKDFAEWQNKLFSADNIRNQEQYWLNILDSSKSGEEIPVLNMPTDYPRPAIQSFEGDSISFSINAKITDKLKEVAKKTESTIYMVLLTAINVLLTKYSGQEDIIIGSPIAGRPHADLHNIIGMFVNTLPMRNYPKAEKSLVEFLKEVRENCLKAYENQDLQFEELVEKLDIKRDLSRNPLFDVMFILQNMDMKQVSVDNLAIKPYKTDNKTSKFDISITAIELENKINIEIEYCTKLFKSTSIKRLKNHLIKILRQIPTSLEKTIEQVSILTEEEENQILIDFNNNRAEYPKNKTIHQLFEEQVEKTPNNTAVEYEGKYLSYRELNNKANQVARVLRNKGVRADSIVAIMIERSLEMIVGILAILKAGGAYLPIDSEYPVDRIGYMLQDSGTNILLTKAELIKNSEISINVENVVDINDSGIGRQDICNLNKISTANNLMYAIYTSGSTGKPKAVMINHSVVNNLINFQENKANISFATKVLQFTTMSFDVCYQEIFSTLLCGGQLVTTRSETIKDIHKLLSFIENREIEVIFMSTSYFKYIVSDEEYLNKLSKKLKHIIVAGEQLVVTKELGKYLKQNSVNLHNHYGPSETHVVSTYTIKTESEIPMLPPIGRPISNVQLYIVDENYKSQPIGVVGQLCIAGDGLGRGYLNKPQLTQKSFVDNPFNCGTKLYKTGDMAKWLEDGNIEFLGRRDYQVKIRGHRIELGEIENKLLNYEEIREAVVISKEDVYSSNYLCAYIVGNKQLSVSELRQYLIKYLPDYMLPSYFIQLEKIPLTANGKVNKKALPQPEGNINTEVEYEAPRTETEEKLVQLWKEALQVSTLGINENFFELGGHSLKATGLLAKVHKELNVEIPLRELFQNPTIKGISQYILSTQHSIYSQIVPIEDKGSDNLLTKEGRLSTYKASSAQQRIYTLNQIEEDSIGYNMPMVLKIKGELDKEKLVKAFKTLIQRHEALRTSLELVEEKLAQIIHKEVEFKLESVDKKIQNHFDIDNIIKDFVRPFDLSKAPLFRAGLVNCIGQADNPKILPKQQHILLLDIHHIISDGVSMSILVKEFAQVYDGKQLPQLKLQYKDYSVWQNQQLLSDRMKKQEKYWLDTFMGEQHQEEIPVLNMPTDFERPVVQSFEGEGIEFRLNEELAYKLKQIASQTGATLYMVILAIFNILLSKYSGQEDIIIGTPIAGRPNVDLQNIIGMFVNTLAMRNYSNGEKSVRQFIKEVKENALKAYENQDYQFEELVGKLNVARDISRNPVFDVMFSMQNMDLELIKLKDLEIKSYKNHNKISKFDMTLTAVEVNKEIALNMQYCTKLFKQSTIERLCRHFKIIAEEITKELDRRINEIIMLSEEEKRKILVNFNNTEVDFPSSNTIHELFEKQVQKTPNSIAVQFKQEKLTYKELNQKSNQLARALREKGVSTESIVGIMLKRSTDMIIAIMAVLKSGGAYLPIDTEYPQDRIKYMLEDSQAKLVLTQTEVWNDLESNIDKLYINEALKHGKENVYGSNIVNSKYVDNKCLAYVIYTSGSTGKPKGVMIEHKSILNFVQGMKNVIDFRAGEGILCLTSISFDIFGLETLLPLVYGMRIVIADEEVQTDGAMISKILESKEIDLLQVTPSRLKVILDSQVDGNSLSRLRAVIVGGEAFPEKLLKQVQAEVKTRIYNVYGPTETTIWSTLKEVTQAEKVTIGTPIANTKIYILGKNNTLQPIGVSGELCIGGYGLARGYYNNYKLTEQRFVDNPFCLGEKIYRTGDMAKWLPNGDIEFLGRIDYQVKIRGYRIELGEIENKLVSHKYISNALVVAKEDTSNINYLCAYYVAKDSVNQQELREYLRNELPEYMLPAYFVELEAMPLNANGKLDRKKLPEPDTMISLTSEYIAPKNDIQQKLCTVFEEVLKVDRIGLKDNFFYLGGDSIKAIQVSARMKKQGLRLKVKDLLRNPIIEDLSKHIEGYKNIIDGDYTPIKIKLNPAKQYSFRNEEIQNIYPLTPMQEGMLFHRIIDKNSTAYFEQTILDIEGSIDIDLYRKSLNNIIQRHDVLRTIFIHEDLENPVQVVLKQREADLVFEDISSLQEEAKESYVKNFIEKDKKKGFDLTSDVLIRLSIIKLDHIKSKLIWSFHHIIMDGWCIGIIMGDFTKLYYSLVNNIEVKLHRAYPYSSYINWLSKQNKEEAIDYWDKYLIGYGEQAIVPKSNTINKQKNYKVEEYKLVISEELSNKIGKLARDNEVTVNTIIQSIWGLVLRNYNNTEDVVFGTVVSGRPADVEGIENMVGLFINTIPVRVNVKHEDIFNQVIKKVQHDAIEAQQYQFSQLAEIQARTKLNNNLIDHIVIFENYPVEEEIGKLANDGALGFSVKKIKSIEETNYEFNMAVSLNKQLSISFGYNVYSYDRQYIKNIGQHIINIIEQVIKNPHIKVRDIEIVKGLERQKLLVDFNSTNIDYPRSKAIHEVFETQVEKNLNNIAVVFENSQLTYKELNQKSNQLARTLRSKGLKADELVGILVHRSIEMIVAIVAVLKAGGAYLPINAEYPGDRVRYILEDSKANILLTEKQYKNNIKFEGIILELQDEDSYAKDSTNLDSINNPKHMAYAIYTSGSTGKPKGVMIEQGSVVNLCSWLNEEYKLYNNKNIMQITNISFDVAVEETLGAILNGATIYIPKEEVILDKEKFRSFVNKHNINMVQFVPITLRELILENEKMQSLEVVICGGDKLEDSLKDKVLDKGYNLYNCYGPTEITVDALTTKCIKGKTTIGKPIGNAKAYILNKNNHLQPIGIAGELCIGGIGVARGYIKREELTRERFIDNPFKGNPFKGNPFKGNPFKYNTDEKIYKTGDLARWLPDGNVQFLGRIDNQVKIRGYRIELGEIENELLNHMAIKQAVVLVKEDNSSNKYLCAYIQVDRETEAQQELTVSSIREYLNKELPEYMIPSYFVKLDKMPLNVNDKIDRNALVNMSNMAEIDGNIATGTAYEAPRNQVEETLVSIWQELLTVKGIGINDNFFDLGGHSLKVTTLVGRIHKELFVQVPLQEVFNNPTIKQISKYIEATEKNIYSQIQPIQQSLENYPKDCYELSSAQKRMYVLNEIQPDSTVYNISAVFKLEGDLDINRLTLTFEKLIQRHESLRTSFERYGEDIVQRIHSQVDFGIEKHSIYVTKDTEVQEINRVITKFIRAFDLSKAPLIRVGLVEYRIVAEDIMSSKILPNQQHKPTENMENPKILPKQQHLLLLDVQHIISDGISVEIMATEFMKIYQGEELPKLRLQYKDYAVWQKQMKKSGNIKEQEKYWLNKFSDSIPILKLPIDRERPKMQCFDGGMIEFELDKAIVLKLRSLCRATGTTMFMLLLAYFNVLLSKCSMQEDIIVGCPIAGRPNTDLDNIIGMFVNTLAIRSYPHADKTFEQFLKEVKQTCLEAYKNQDYQLEELIEKLSIRRDSSRNPLFDVVFSYQDVSRNQETKEQKSSEQSLSVQPYKIEGKISKFDMSFTAIDSSEKIKLYLEYSTALFEKSTVIIIIEAFKDLINKLIDNISMRISEIELYNYIKEAVVEEDEDVDFDF